MLPALFTGYPTVYIYEDTYHIMIPLEKPALCWIQVGDQTYCDHFAGVLRSDTLVHRCIVPRDLLDRVGGYRVYYRKIIDRVPYYPQSEEPECCFFSFRPVPTGEARFYHLADMHSRMLESCIRVAAHWEGKLDGLILNGDIPNHCGEPERPGHILQLAGAITKGAIPVVFARGNHDTRGAYAEKLGDYIPHREGRTYYTFRLGDIWGLVLDCGEDKPDPNIEYGGTICFHAFRQAEDAFIRSVLAKGEYRDPAIKHRVVVAHMPFSRVNKPPFDIELPLYREWCTLLREEIQPEFMLCGHLHRAAVYLPGGELDQLGQPCPILIGGKPAGKEPAPEEPLYIGALCHFTPEGIHITFNDETGKEKHA